MPKLVVGCPGAVAEEYCLLQGGDFRGYVGDDDFFGNGGLAGQLVRMSLATAMMESLTPGL